MVTWLKAAVITVSLIVAAGSALILKLRNNPPVVTEIVEGVHEIADDIVEKESGITIDLDKEETAPVETDSNSTGTEKDKVS